MKKILGIIVFSLVLRLLLSPFGTWAGDMGSWIGWSNRLMEVGFGRFYEAWSDYLPGYMYVLFLWGNLWKVLPHIVSQEVFYKLPSIMADGVTVYLIYLIVKGVRPAYVPPVAGLRRGEGERNGLIAAFLYGISPAIWGNSALWGQADGFAAMPVVMAVYFLIKGNGRGNPAPTILAGVCLGVGAVLKPAGMFLGPLITTAIILNGRGNRAPTLKNILFFLIPAAAVFLLAFEPFRDGQDLILFIISRFQATLDQYKYTSLNAFNFWGVGGGWKDDGVRFGVLTLQQWGVVMFGVIYGAVLINVKCQMSNVKTKTQMSNFLGNVILSCAIIFLAGFLFLTRAHERHIFPVFPFLAIAAGIRPRLWIAFIALSIISALNLYYAYTWLSKSFEQVFSSTVVSGFSGVSIIMLAVLIFELIRNRSLKLPKLLKKDGGEKRMPVVYQEKEERVDNWKKYFVAILILGIMTRFVYLNTPPNLMFDEVYHAFTAQEMVKGNVAAWEWWNTPPEGKAYEWSHPPFAKLAMAVPLKIFGVEKAWAYRSAVALFGVGVIVLMYLVTQLLFGQKAGLLAMLLTTLDGLILTQSRIGMNDIFFVFWMLVSVYCFLRWVNCGRGDRAPTIFLALTGIALGLSLSAKWAAVYGVGILGLWYVICLILNTKDKIMAIIEGILKGFVFFVVIPLIVYLIIYIPFFTSGHDFSKFVELQKQMWWYHTGLRATHPFQSQFWQWPLNLRPVWFWVDYKETTTANIYNLGNPAVFWGGSIAVVVVITVMVYRLLKSLKLLREMRGSRVFPVVFVLSGLLGFWVPWAVSPRIMFFYHFLPSLLFMITVLAWVLTKIKDKRVLWGYFVIVAVLFLYFSPIWYGFPVPKELVDQFFWIKSWR